MFAPDFEKMNGLVPAIVQDDDSGEVLMLAFMNLEAWEATLARGKAVYYSRSRGQLWEKGETSGHQQLVREIRIDCDRDTVLLRVEQLGGAACHKGYRSCFHNQVQDGTVSICEPRIFDPRKVYGK
jgi:phosphoribosyl-AMP cyclohydrolase